MNDLSNERHDLQPALPDDAVWWHDGLLLDAAHFQRMCRRQEQLVSYHVRNSAPYNWGVRILDIEDRSLTDGVFAISRLEAVLPDGLFVSHDGSCGRLELALDEETGPALATAGKYDTICLAVPANEAIGADDPLARYAPVDGAMAADGGVERVRPRLRLALASELERKSSETMLPLARIGFRLNKFELQEFLPPLLDIGVAPACAEGKSLRADSSRLLRTMQRVVKSLLAATAQSPAGIEEQLRRFELRQRLAGVAAGVPVLEGLLGLPSVAPLALYLAWCQALGPMGVLDETGAVLRRPFPDYRHDDLHTSFRALFQRAADLLAMANRQFDEVALKVNADHQYSHVFDSQHLYTWPAWPGEAGEVAAGRRDLLLIGVRGMTRELADSWLEGAVITQSAELRRYRMGRSLGAARSAIEADGKLAPLDRLATASGHKVEVRGMATPDVVLYAIDLDETLRLDADIVLQNPAARQPSEIVLFVHKAAQ